jgi:hypothetical protein
MQAYIKSKKKNYWLAVLLGIALGVFYAYQTGNTDKKKMAGYGAIGGIALCLIYKALWGDEAELVIESNLT